METIKTIDTIEFQLYDWFEDHEPCIDEDGDEIEDSIGNYIIKSFGRTEDGKSVYAKIVDYTPYFYALLPDRLQNLSKQELNIIIEKMSTFLKDKDNYKIYKKYKPSLKEVQLVRLKRAEGFTNDKEYWFVRFVFCV